MNYATIEAIKKTSILHSLLGINKADDLLGHPVCGASWEGFAMENILSQLPGWQAAFFRTSVGAEIDLVLTKGRKKIACEFKASTAPQVTRGFWNALDDLKISEAWIIAPVKEAYPIKKDVITAPIDIFLEHVRSKE